MTRKRVYEIAKELGISSKELIAKLAEMGMSGLKAANTVDDDEHALIVNLYQEEGASPVAVTKEEEPVVEVEEKPVRRGDPRPPIVSVLGHIDHGKTTLLDAIRDSHLTAKEAGGITQGVAAYQVDLHGKMITFIDTPGHKAFTGMRARGAKATDIAILVVAADDGVMAQTQEAIDHIHAAKIPMIVAVNKIDKPNANVDKVMNDLTKHGLTPEAWGGETITVPVSALKLENIEDLLQMILLVAEMEDLRGDPKGELEAIIIESHLSSGRGPVGTMVVKNGTLHEKDYIVAGTTYGRVKALIDETGKRIREVGPGQVAEVLGLQEVPPVGTPVEVEKNQNQAKVCAAQRKAAAATPRRSRAKMSVEDLFREAMEAEKLQLILKASSTGAQEAARRENESLDVGDVQVEFLHSGVGTVSEGDVLLAASLPTDCLVVGFGVKADAKAAKFADREGIPLLTYDIIYDLLDEIERALKQRLAPEYKEVKLGEVEVRQLFKAPGGVIAGCYVADGKVTRKGKVHIIRQGEAVFDGEIASLRRFDDDVKEVQTGRECGIRLKDFDDVEVGDRFIVFSLEEIER